MLTHEILLESIHYDPVTGIFTKNGKKTGFTQRIGRKTKRMGMLCIKGKRYSAHRVAVFYMTGEWPKNEVDHRNGDSTDNRYENLRPCTRIENQRNVAYANDAPHGARGICKSHRKRKPWVVRIGTGTGRTSKSFELLEDAIAWRKEMERILGYSERHGTTAK